MDEWIDPPDSVEAVYRAIRDALFADRDLVSLRDPDGLISAYLDGLVAPLNDLGALGLQLVAVMSRGHLQTRAGAEPFLVNSARYIIAPDWAAFRDAAGVVHLLGTDCLAAERSILRSEVQGVWPSEDELVQVFEASIPWCAGCQLDALELRQHQPS